MARENMSLQPPGRTGTLDSRVDGGLSRVTCRTPSPSRQGYICCTIAAMREATLEHAAGLTLYRGLSTKSPWACLRRPELSCPSRRCRDNPGEEGGNKHSLAKPQRYDPSHRDRHHVRVYSRGRSSSLTHEDEPTRCRTPLARLSSIVIPLCQHRFFR
jgi:hypothetical protein